MTMHRIAAVVLSPNPWRAPIWTIGSHGFRHCPHRSAVLHDFRKFMGNELDKSAPSLETMLNEWGKSGTGLVRVFREPIPPGSGSRSSPTAGKTVYFLRRSSSHGSANTTTSCSRCLWNVERLCEELVRVLPKGSRVLLTNPGELPFIQQYSLVRHADLLVGVHGSALALGLFLTPSQAYLELPLPSSPGLNDWLSATLGARTACVQACLPNHLASNSRGCSAHGGDGDLAIIVQSVVDLLMESPTSQERPIVWHQLGWKSDAEYGRQHARL